MFTDLLNLPLNRDRATHADQTLSLAGMAWDDYERLTEENFGYRISYLDGVITIRWMLFVICYSLFVRYRVLTPHSSLFDQGRRCS